jgi:hypothetical protein
VKLLALLLLATGLVFAGERDGGFSIRFEPTAILQAGAPIPFQITVSDARHQPLAQAKVTLQIETDDHQKVQVFKAVGTTPGMYIAKPVFPEAGAWSIYVHVQFNDQFGERTIKFNVSDPQN